MSNSTAMSDAGGSPTSQLRAAAVVGSSSGPPTETPLQRTRHYVPRIVLRQLLDRPDETWWVTDGTVVFVDISGFTKLSERLARRGREGAENIADAIGHCFSEILAVAYDNGGSLIKFGGDALLLFFQDEGHVERACRSASGMRRALREAGRIDLPGARVQLRMSVGVHSGGFHFFMVGGSHRELIVTGPAWTKTVEMEHVASAGQVLVSAATAARLPARCLGPDLGTGRLLQRAPSGRAEPWRDERVPVPPDAVSECLSVAVREHVLGGGGAPEHRPVTVAFVHFDGTDALIEHEGPAATAETLNVLVADVTAAADDQGVAFLSSDVDTDGGKLILAAGAPRVTGNDEERMLLALRAITDGERVIRTRIGVHRGAVFGGDIGPWYRQTYTVMGDVVNLAARLMAKAEPGQIVATADVLDRSWTLFETTPLEPFMVKGKARPIQAWTVGAPTGSRGRSVALERFPLVGRDPEMTVLAGALAPARLGHGRLVVISGEPGAGKTRLLEELRSRAEGFTHVHATCEAYTSTTPYVTWREILRPLLGLGWDDPDEVVAAKLRAIVDERAPDLVPWLPLLALPLDAEEAPTPETEALGEQFRRARLHEVVVRFVEVALSGPAFIEIEDAHHMDEASADLLRALDENLDRWPWLIVVTRRTEPGGFSPVDESAALRIEAGPLELADAVVLAEAATEADPLPDHAIQTIAERSGGNPQFLRELVRAALATGGVDQLPDSVEAAAMARIDRLSPADRTIVRRAAVLGSSFRSRSIGWVLESGEPLPDRATWVRLSEIFEDDGEGYLRFRRALLRDAAYEGLPYRVRRQLHGQVGERLEAEAQVAGAVDDAADLLSLHFLRAGVYDRAWRYGRLAGDHARARGAPIEAAVLYRRALDAGKRSGAATPAELSSIHEVIGEALHQGGDFYGAMRSISEAARLAADDPLDQARLLLQQAYAMDLAGQAARQVRLARRAFRLLVGRRGRRAAGLRSRGLWLEAWGREYQARHRDAVRLADAAISEAVAGRDPLARARAELLADWALFNAGALGEPVRGVRALATFRSGEDRRGIAGAANLLGNIAYYRGRWDEAVSLWNLLRSTAEELGDPVGAARGTYNAGEVLSDQGHLHEAEQAFRRAIRSLRAAHVEDELALATADLGRVRSRQGRFDEARALLAEAKETFDTLGVNLGAPIDSWRVESLILEGRWLMAQAELDVLIPAERDPRVGAMLHRLRAYCRARQGREGEARSDLERSVALAYAAGSDYERAVGLAALVELWPDDPAAEEHRSGARLLLERLGVIDIAHPPPR